MIVDLTLVFLPQCIQFLVWLSILLIRHRAIRMYNNEGVRLSDGADVCDCLVQDCPGCHFPCSRCSSPKCGGECRINRCWFYTEIVTEGGRSRIISDLLKVSSYPSTSKRVHC